MQFIPIVEHVQGQARQRALRHAARQYGRFLIDVFEEWVPA
jgi:sulfatase maturation enzyme AslB (radical SAM superfamily)